MAQLFLFKGSDLIVDHTYLFHVVGYIALIYTVLLILILLFNHGAHMQDRLENEYNLREEQNNEKENHNWPSDPLNNRNDTTSHDTTAYKTNQTTMTKI